MTEQTQPNNAAAIIEAIERLSGAAIINLQHGVDVIVLPAGQKVASIKALIDEYRAAPERIETVAKLLAAESFIDYANRFKRPDTAVFIRDDPESPAMQAVIDYHGADDPRFCRHRAVYAFPLSDPMKAWVRATKDGLFSQADFATFLQDREYDIENPPLDWSAVHPDRLALVLDLFNIHDDKGDIDDGAGDPDDDDLYVPRSAIYKLRRIRIGSVQRITALGRGIEITATAKATTGYSPKTGERTVTFTEEHTAGSPDRRVSVPDAFFVHIPVFEGGARHLLPVRLRYRLVAGTVKWGVELIDAPRLIRSAIRSVAAEVADRTGLPVLYGAPE